MIPIKNMLAVSLLMLMPAAAQAQENIKKAFDALVENDAADVSARHKLDKDPDTDEKVSQLDVWEFTLPKSQIRLVKDIERAFERDKEKAYTVGSGKFPHTSAEEYEALAVGDGSEVYYVGAIKGSNYIYAAFIDDDAADDNHRYAYALEWKETDEGTVIGKLAITYATTLKYRQQRNAFSGSQRKITVQPFRMNTKYDSTTWLGQFSAYAKMFREHPDKTASPFYANLIYDHCKKAKDAGLTEDDRELVLEELTRLIKLTEDEFTKGMFKNARSFIEP